MRELTTEEVQDVNGGGLLGAVVAVLMTPVSPAVAVVAVVAALTIGAISLATRD
ncbi:MAG: hypothetical protein ACK51V_01035 [bacterium]|jgi:hypothetical protein